MDFEAVVREHQDRVYSFALSMTGSPADAQDLSQETFWRAYRVLQKWPAGRPLAMKAYLLKITLNLQRNRVRYAKKLVHLNGEEPDHRSSPEDVAIARTRTRELVKQLQGLPVRYREAVVLRYAQDLAYEDIAKVLGRPVGTVKSDVHRGLGLLRGGSNGTALD